jgi:hypothetical protein
MTVDIKMDWFEMRSKSVSKRGPVVLLLISALVVIGIGILIINAIVTHNSPKIVKSQDDVPRVSVEDAYRAVVEGEAVLVDTRSLESYQQGHAASAISLPVDDVEVRLGELDPARWYITYCT